MQSKDTIDRNFWVMASLESIKQGILAAKNELLAALSPEALMAGADIAALVENRIVSTGTDSTGKRLSPYSTKELPAFFYFGRSRNQKGEATVRKKAKQGAGVSYREFRQFNGLNVSNKNLEFTGEMWQGFGVVGAVSLSPGIVEVTIGGKNQRTRQLLGYHSEREGTNVTAPSNAELQAVSAGISARLVAIIQKNLSK